MHNSEKIVFMEISASLETLLFQKKSFSLSYFVKLYFSSSNTAFRCSNLSWKSHSSIGIWAGSQSTCLCFLA